MITRKENNQVILAGSFEENRQGDGPHDKPKSNFISPNLKSIQADSLNHMNNPFDYSGSFDMQGSFDHKKQGLTFLNEENLQVKNLSKKSVGQSIVNFDSLPRDDQSASAITPDSFKLLHQQQQQQLRQKILSDIPSAVHAVEQNNQNDSNSTNALIPWQPTMQTKYMNGYFTHSSSLHNSSVNLNSLSSTNNNNFNITHSHQPGVNSNINNINNSNNTNIFNGVITNGFRSASRMALGQDIDSGLNLNSDKDQASKFLGSQIILEELSKNDRNILAPSDSCSAMNLKRRSVDTGKSNNPNHLQIQGANEDRSRLASLESPTKLNNSRYDQDSIRRGGGGGLSRQKSGLRNDTVPNTENGVTQKRGGGGQSKGVFSLKFLISIKPKLKKFLTSRTIFGRTKLLSNRVRNYINDAADYSKHSNKAYNAARKLIDGFLYNLEKTFKFFGLNRLPLFDPESKIKILINSLIVAYNCFYIILISMQLIFDAEVGHLEEYFTNIALGSWITEMLMEMNTVCYHHNHFVTDRKQIIKIYAKEYFFFEILPLMFEGRTSQNTFFNVLLHLPLLLKIKGMSIILAKLEFYILQVLEKHYIFQLCKLIMQMFLYGHIVACCWNLVVKIESHLLDTETWLDGQQIEAEEWWQRYIMAQYWAFSVMMNVSTKPMTILELGFTSVMMVLSCIAFGYLLSTVAAVISELNRQQKDYKKDLNTLNSYMKRKKLDLSLKRRVNINLRTYYQQKSRDNIEVEKKALSKLSNEMLYELHCQSNSKILKQFPFFSKIFSEQTITKMYFIMEEEVYAPQQMIFTKQPNQPDQHHLYLILKGQVNISIENFIAPNNVEEDGTSNGDEEDETSQYDEFNNLIVKQTPCIVRRKKTVEDKVGAKRKLVRLKQGQIFGAYSFFTGTERLLEIQCKEFATLIRLNRQKFMAILQDNKKDYEKFCEISDKMRENRTIEEIPDQQCLICNSREHLYDRCPLGHFDKNNILMLFKHNHSAPQEREKTFRMFTKKIHHSLHERANLRREIIEYRNRNNIDYYSSGDDNSDPYNAEEIEETEDDDGELQEGDSQAAKTYVSEDTEEQLKIKKNKDLLTVVDDDSKLIHTQFNNIHSNMSPSTNSKQQRYPPSEIEITRPEEDVYKIRTTSQKINLENEENVSLNEDFNQTPNMNIPRSPSRKQSCIRQTKPRKSLVKFSEPNVNNNGNPNGSTPNSQQVPSQISSLNNATGNGMRRPTDATDNNKRKSSYINVPSPMMGSQHDNSSNAGIPDNNNNNIQSGMNFNGRDVDDKRRRRTFIQTQQSSHGVGGVGHQSSLHHHHGVGFNQPQSQTNLYSSQNQNEQLMNQQQWQQMYQIMQQQQQMQHFGGQAGGGGGVEQQNTVFTRISNNQKSGVVVGINQNMNSFNYRKVVTMMQQQTMEEQSLIWGFDKQKDFMFYFPYYNCINVLRRYQNYQGKYTSRHGKMQKSKKINETTGTKRRTKQLSQSKINSMHKLNSLVAKQSNLGIKLQSQNQNPNSNELSLNIVQVELSKQASEKPAEKQQSQQQPVKTDKILEDFLKLQAQSPAILPEQLPKKQ